MNASFLIGVYSEALEEKKTIRSKNLSKNQMCLFIQFIFVTIWREIIMLMLRFDLVSEHVIFAMYKKITMDHLQ